MFSLSELQSLQAEKSDFKNDLKFTEPEYLSSLVNVESIFTYVSKLLVWLNLLINIPP